MPRRTGSASTIAIVGALIMMAGVLANGDVWLVVGCGVYLASLVAVYAMSTLSHSSRSVKWKSLFRQLDQAFIYLLIVATYTPFSIAVFARRPMVAAPWGNVGRGAGWVCREGVFRASRGGCFGRIVRSIGLDAHHCNSRAVAMLLRWSVGQPMIGGGLCYTVGTLFLIYDERVRHFHAAWHLCVIAGSTCHFLGLFVFVVHGGI